MHEAMSWIKYVNDETHDKKVVFPHPGSPTINRETTELSSIVQLLGLMNTKNRSCTSSLLIYLPHDITTGDKEQSSCG